MDNVLVDERRIKVDFSNSVSKLWNNHHKKKLQEKAHSIIDDINKNREKVGIDKIEVREPERDRHHHRD